MNCSIDIPQRTGQEEVLHSSIEAHAKSSTAFNFSNFLEKERLLWVLQLRV
jgi:hypothetical protein